MHCSEDKMYGNVCRYLCILCLYALGALLPAAEGVHSPCRVGKSELALNYVF